MNALYEAGQAFGFEPEQIEALVFFWDLPHKTPEELRTILRTRLYLSNPLIDQFISTFSSCMHEQHFDIPAFCQQLWSKHQVLEASALLLYFQQQYFNKPSIEERTTQLTQFTLDQTEKIKSLASTTFAMTAREETTRPADMVLIFGAKAKTCALYYHYFQMESAKYSKGLGKPYIFLSTRPLLNDRTDNPAQDSTFFYPSEATQTYHDYLRTQYLPRYNHFLAKSFFSTKPEQFKPITVLTEGLVMFERYEHMFQISFESAYEQQQLQAIYTEQQDAFGFYSAALSLAVRNRDVTPHGTIALSSLQPYLSYYEALFEAVKQEFMSQMGIEGTSFHALRGIAYGPSNEPSPALIAQRLAAVIDIKYPHATKTLQKQIGFDNFAIIPKESLRAVYLPKPVLFVCSSTGDAELAKDTIRRLSALGRNCTIISFAIADITLSLTQFAQDVPQVSIVAHLNDKPIMECHEHEIRDYIHIQGFAHAYVGLPSNDADEMAFKLALVLHIPVVFVNEFMFEPPCTHVLWHYREALLAKENITFTESLASSVVFAIALKRQIIGHRSLFASTSQAMISSQERSIMHTQLNVGVEQRLIVVSGTTQMKGVDTTFLNALLNELPRYPSIQVRYSIHPSVKETMSDYIQSLIEVANEFPVIEQFKIILNSAIINKITPDCIKKIQSSPWVCAVNISGPQALEITDGFAQAVPGAAVNTNAMRSKPTFSGGNAALLPKVWFAEHTNVFFQAVATFDREAPLIPHTLKELGLSEENTPADVLVRLMM